MIKEVVVTMAFTFQFSIFNFVEKIKSETIFHLTFRSNCCRCAFCSRFLWFHVQTEWRVNSLAWVRQFGNSGCSSIRSCLSISQESAPMGQLMSFGRESRTTTRGSSVPRRPYLVIGGRQFYDFAFFPSLRFHAGYALDNTWLFVRCRRTNSVSFSWLYGLLSLVNCNVVRKTL